MKTKSILLLVVIMTTLFLGVRAQNDRNTPTNDTIQGIFLLEKDILLTIPESYKHASTVSDLYYLYGADKLDLYDYAQGKNLDIMINTYQEPYIENPSHKLKAGEKYDVEFWRMIPNSIIPFDTCLTFMQSRNACFVGYQGLVLLWSIKKSEFPDYYGEERLNYGYLMFDDKDHLPTREFLDEMVFDIPGLYNFNSEEPGIQLGWKLRSDVSKLLPYKGYLVCFRKIN